MYFLEGEGRGGKEETRSEKTGMKRRDTNG